MIRAYLLLFVTISSTYSKPALQNAQDLRESCSDKIGVTTDERYIQDVRCWLAALPQKEDLLEYLVNLTLSLREPLDGWKLTTRMAYHPLQLDGVEMNSPLGVRNVAYYVDGEVVVIQDESIATGTLEIAFRLTDRRNEAGKGNTIWPLLLHLQCLRCSSADEEPGVPAQMCSGDKFYTQATFKRLATGQTPYYNGIITLHRSHPLSHSPSSCVLEMHTNRVRIHVHGTTGCSLLQRGGVLGTNYVVALGNKEPAGVCVVRVSYLHPYPLPPSSYLIMCTTCNDMTNSNVNGLKRRSTEEDTICDDEDHDCPSGSGSGSGSGTEDAGSSTAIDTEDATTQIPTRGTEVSSRGTEVPSSGTLSTSMPGTTVSPTRTDGTSDNSRDKPTTIDSDKTDVSPTNSSPASNKLETGIINIAKDSPTSSPASNKLETGIINIAKDSPTSSPASNKLETDNIINIAKDSPTRGSGIHATSRNGNSTTLASDLNLAREPEARTDKVTSSGVWIGIGTAGALLLLCALISITIIVRRKRKSAGPYVVNENMVTEATPNVHGPTPMNNSYPFPSAAAPISRMPNMAFVKHQQEEFDHLDSQNTTEDHALPPPPYPTEPIDVNDAGYNHIPTLSTKPENDGGQSVNLEGTLV